MFANMYLVKRVKSVERLINQTVMYGLSVAREYLKALDFHWTYANNKDQNQKISAMLWCFILKIGVEEKSNSTGMTMKGHQNLTELSNLIQK